MKRSVWYKAMPACVSARNICATAGQLTGVGKSTVIEQLALAMIREGHKTAVLAIDPSSLMTGGSVLADATRMQHLVGEPDAFVRPSPSMAHLGGMTRATEQAIALCEAAGYSRVVVETVGVGQSETDASRIADVTLLLLSPLGGDHLQDMKKGVLESADVVAVTRADGATAELSASRVHELQQSLHTGVLPSAQRVVPCSGLTRQGVQEVLQAIDATAATLRQSGALQHRKADRQKFLLQEAARRLVEDKFKQSRVFVDAIPRLAQTLDGQVGCYENAARTVYDMFVKAAAKKEAL